MRENRVWLFIGVLVSSLVAYSGNNLASTEETLTFPINGFREGIARESRKDIQSSEGVITLPDGTRLPCREYRFKLIGKSFLLDKIFTKPLNFKDDWHELKIVFQCVAAGNDANNVIHNVELRTLNHKNKTFFKMPSFDPETGLCEVRWNISNSAPLTDLSKMEYFGITVNAGAWNKGKWQDENGTITLRVSDLIITKHDRWAELYPARKQSWLDWQNFIANFKPDYSDGSKYLSPPATGRIKTPLPLVKNGAPHAELVITKDPFGVIEHAAKDFQSQVKMISGAELPVLESPGTMSVKIHVNDPRAAELYPDDMAYIKDLEPYYGEDGFFIRAKGNEIYIGSLSPVGARNALYRLLENNTDIIWARQDETFGTVYTKTNKIDIVWADARFKPTTPFRGWLGARPAWSARNGGNSNIPTEWGGPVKLLGNFSDYLPNKPPYQVFVNGEYVSFGYYKSQVCISQPDAYQLILDKMCARVQAAKDKGQNVRSINWVVEDNWLVCTCSDCTKPITLPGGTVLKSNGKSEKSKMASEEVRFRCNQFYLMANRLARGLRAKHPDVKLQVLAYFFMEPAPDFPLEDNIVVLFAPLYTRHDFRNPTSAPSNERLWRQRDKYKNQKVELALYEYYFQDPAAEVMKYDIPDYLSAGFRDIGSELPSEFGRADVWHHWDFAMVEYWCFTRLAMDYTQDTEQLRKYFINRVYHEGAPVIEKFYGLIRAGHYAGLRAQRESKYTKGLGSGELVAETHIFKAGKGEELLSELKATLPKITNPTARINFGRFLNLYEDYYKCWLEKTTSKSGSVKEKGAIAQKTVDLHRNQIMFRWGSNPDVSRVLTTVEFDGKFHDAVRFRFTPNAARKGKELSLTGIFHSKHMGNSAPVPLPGILTFKLRVLTPGLDPKKVMSFGAHMRGVGTQMTSEKDFTSLGKGIYEIRFAPTGKLPENLDGYRVSYPRDAVDPAVGHAEFEIFDINVAPL